MEEDLGLFDDFKACISPRAKDFNFNHDQKHLFNELHQDFKMETALPHTELIWENNEIPTILSRSKLVIL